MPEPSRCPGCRAIEGRLHDWFCLEERCPFCGGQLATCLCIVGVLGLDEAERRALDAYVDDSVEPLRGLVERWRQALVAKGRVPFRAPTDRITTWLTAASRGELAAVRAMLAEGTAVDLAVEGGGTALMTAARHGRLEMVECLLAAGARADLAAKDGLTALHACVMERASDPARQAACAQRLIDAGASLDAVTSTGLTPLMFAAWSGATLAAEALLAAGAARTRTNPRGETAEDLARKRGHAELADRLAATRR